MTPASRRFSIWYFAVFIGMESLSVISVRLFGPSARIWRISPAMGLAMAFAIFCARSSPGSRTRTFSAIERRKDPFASDFQRKVELGRVRAAALRKVGFSAAFAPEELAYLPDDLTGIDPEVTGCKDDPGGFPGPCHQCHPAFGCHGTGKGR